MMTIVALSALPSYPSNEEVVGFNRRLFPKNPKSVLSITKGQY
jgi:hypothetical protein